MNISRPLLGTTVLIVSGLLTSAVRGTPGAAMVADGAPATGPVAPVSFPVSGSSVHYFSTAVIHSESANGATVVQRSTDIIRLTGDLDGYVLYHPITTIDTDRQTLLNTGTQVFSGTVAGSDPVILHDDQFRFEVDLGSGDTRGEVFLSRSADAPPHSEWFDCALVVVGKGMTPEGDNIADYTGQCTVRSLPN